MPSRRAVFSVTLFVVLGLTLVGLAGCGSAKGASRGSSSATSGVKGAKSTSRTAGLVRIAATSTFEPPSYTGYEPLPVFTYHHIDPKVTDDITITPAKLEAELKLLARRGYHGITARQLWEHEKSGTPLPDKPVMLTFDDGWRTQYTHAVPLLKKYGFSATFFINPFPISRRYPAYLTQGMVKKLAKAGNDIESHTWAHLPLIRTRNQTPEEFWHANMWQLDGANKWIRSTVGTEPVALCYPYGYYDLEAVGMAERAGCHLGFTTLEGVADARRWDAFQMRRYVIGSDETTASFVRRLESQPLQVTDIQPPPAMRVAGGDTTITVDITDVPADIADLRITAGPRLHKARIFRRAGRRYLQAAIRNGTPGFRQVTVRGIGPDGRYYYASWGLVIGDRPGT